jgi:hypothetical protein
VVEAASEIDADAPCPEGPAGSGQGSSRHQTLVPRTSCWTASGARPP